MSYTNTALLGLIEPVTGTQAGVWGDDVNLGLTTYVDLAIAGTNNITVNTDITLVITTGTYAGSGVTTNTAQYAILNCTGARTAIRYINAPASSKVYNIINNTSGGFAVVIRGTNAGPTYTTGVSISPGENAIVAWDTIGGGTPDFVKIASNSFAGLTGVVPIANGGTGASTAAGARTNLDVPTTGGTGATGTWPIAISGNAATATSATTASSISGGSAGQLVYQTAGSSTNFAPAPTTGYVLSWTGTAFNWIVGVPSGTSANLSGGGAYTVVYQSSTGVTAYLTNGTTGQVLSANTGAAPSYINQSAMSVGSATTATNLSGGGAFTIVYQTSTGATSYLTNGSNNQVLTSNSGGAPSWTNSSAFGTSNSKLYYFGQF